MKERFFFRIMNKKVQVTKQGLEELKAEYHELVNVKRPKLIERLEYARSQGDLSENSDYQNAKDELEFLDGRIEELEHVLNNAQVVESSNGKKDKVSVGTRVTIKTGGAEHVYQLVGEWEADPVNKKISHESPLGQALLGKEVGEEVQVDAPVGKINYEIVNIE